MASKKKEHSSVAKTVGIGAAFVAAAAAAAGAYFFYGTSQGVRQRKKLRGWAIKMKGEVIEQLEKLKDINEEAYHRVVETVAEKYRKMKNVEQADVEQIVGEMKKHWRNVRREMEGGKRKRTSAKGKTDSTSGVSQVPSDATHTE